MARPKKVQKPLPEGLVLGTNVRYYSENGWKTGLLDGYKNGFAIILPIGGYKTDLKCHKKVDIANVEAL
jgi:hypothetical protein